MKRFLLLVWIAAPLAAQTTPPVEGPMRETISVGGTGHATLTPDRFTFTAGVQSTAPTVEEAVNENNTKMNAVIAALKKAGATDQEVRTSNFSIYPQQVYEQGKAPHVVGYQANNTVIVTKRDVAAASKLLQVALSAGVNETSNLNFEVSDPSRGREQGLRAAFEDARAQAALLAQAAGRSLGRAMTISTSSSEAPPPPRPLYAMAGVAKAESVSQVPVESGSRELTYYVAVVFEMR
jgi:uncharacterized protein YggE